MGLFDRFKKSHKKEKKLIPDNPEIEDEELRLKEIAINHKDRLETCVEKRLTVGAPGKDAMKAVLKINKEFLDSIR